VADKAGCCHGLHASLTVTPGRPALREGSLVPSRLAKVAVGEASRHSF
jgi:hypothetical protein